MPLKNDFLWIAETQEELSVKIEELPFATVSAFFGLIILNGYYLAADGVSQSSYPAGCADARRHIPEEVITRRYPEWGIIEKEEPESPKPPVHLETYRVYCPDLQCSSEVASIIFEQSDLHSSDGCTVIFFGDQWARLCDPEQWDSSADSLDIEEAIAEFTRIKDLLSLTEKTCGIWIKLEA